MQRIHYKNQTKEMGKDKKPVFERKEANVINAIDKDGETVIIAYSLDGIIVELSLDDICP